MRPYLAILKDSFREALVSRVLWILLLLGTLLLALLAPVGISEQAAASFQGGDILDFEGLVRKLRAGGAKPRPTPAGQVWKRLDGDLRARLAEPGGGGRASGFEQLELQTDLNEMLDDRRLYDAEAWSGVRLGPEAESLLAKGQDKLVDADLSRFNRLLIEAAFPGEIAASGDAEFRVTYLGRTLLGPLPGDPEKLLQQALGGVIDFFLGTVGVFAAILVTASIMPQTFEPGAIDLLLSKPISRALLYVTKYLGGCAFILLNAVYLIGGLWLILGLRFDIWSGRLLWCIPLLMFLFAIYYSVSSLAGTVWKNAIISVVITVLFWGLCFSVGTAKNLIEQMSLQPDRLTRLLPAGNELVAASEAGELLRWNEEQQTWSGILVEEDRPSMPFISAAPPVGLVYDGKRGRVVGAPPRYPQAPFLSAGSGLLVGGAADDWNNVAGVNMPAGTAALFIDGDSGLVAVTPRGIFQLEGDPAEKPRTARLLGMELPLTNTGAQFVAAGETMSWRTPISAARHPASGALAAYDGKTLALVQPGGDGHYELARRIEFQKSHAGVVSLAGDTVLLGQDSGEIRAYDAGLKLRARSTPQEGNAPRFIEASPDGRYFAIVFHHRRLWLYETEAGRFREPELSGQGEITAAVFTRSGELLVADQFQRVTRYRLDPLVAQGRHAPRLGLLERSYRYGIKPLYTVFPKPGELTNMIHYLLTEEETVAMTPEADNLSASRARLDVWGPVWSCLAFVAVVVGLGCLYTARKDF